MQDENCVSVMFSPTKIIEELQEKLDKDDSLKIINVHGEGFRLMKE